MAAGSNVSACLTADGDLCLWISNTNLELGKGLDDSGNVAPMEIGRVLTLCLETQKET